jgi:hyperpolarization activated cyclic nucleotide-gated potassium channel 1
VFIAKLDGFGPDTWVFRAGYIDDEDGTLYLASLYWAFTTMSTVGYGDITAYTDLEKTLAIILMLFGVCFFSFVIGSLASIFNRIDSHEAVLNNKMAIIDEFAKES